MAFSSFEAGTGASAGAAWYPFRTMGRDALERAVQIELSRLLDRSESLSDKEALGSHGTERDMVQGLGETYDGFNWFFSDESPLLLQNIPDYVLDPHSSLRAISERIDGPIHTSNLSGPEITGTHSHLLAGELEARLVTFAELDAERILASPRRLGTPKGETRTHYVWLISPDRDIPNRDFKEIILHIIWERYPEVRILGYIHRDTDSTHMHLWLSAELTNNRKLNVGEVKQADGTIVDKYRDLDEQVALEVSRYFNDPSIYEEHIAKKQEWLRWKERFADALKKGERPPIMPYRARHAFDYVGQRIALADKEKEPCPTLGRNGKAPPMPRTKSLIGALELWGKTVHLQARVEYRRELIASLDAWRHLIDYPVNGIGEHFERQLAEAEREYEQHRNAFDKTLENRARKGYPELKYPLYNSRQIEEMREIALLKHNVELLHYVHEYLYLDRPAGREEWSREIGERWRDEILARIEVHELAIELQRIAQLNIQSASISQSDDLNSDSNPFDQTEQIINGWAHGNWTTQQMTNSLSFIENESMRYHANRYVKACEYWQGTRELLDEYRREDERLIARPAMEEAHVARINHLLEQREAVPNQEERAFLREIVSYVETRNQTRNRFERLIDQSLAVDSSAKKEITHAVVAPEDLHILKANDERWMSKLAGVTRLKETEALALAMRSPSIDRSAEVQADARGMREMLSLAQAVRASWGQTSDSPSIKLSLTEQRKLDGHLQFISEQIQLHNPGWSPQQVERIKEFDHCLLPELQKKLSRTLEREQLRLTKKQRLEELKGITDQLDHTAQSFARGVYETKGPRLLRDRKLFSACVEALTERYLQAIEAEGKTPKQLDLSEGGLRAKARGALTESIKRFEKEELEINELSRLEARKILAEELNAVNVARTAHFDSHCHFVKWNYRTIDGRLQDGISLAEARLRFAEQESLGERADFALMVVIADAREKIALRIQEISGHLMGDESRSRDEAVVLRMQYHARLQAHQRKGLSVREPLFTSEELGKLEECIIETCNAELSRRISLTEESNFGMDYAARRSLGRSLTAEIIEHNEYSLAAKYDAPLDLRKHPYLSPQLRAELSQALERHTQAREAEKSRAYTYRESLAQRAEELKSKCVANPAKTLNPLLVPREANIIFPSVQAMSAHNRLIWENKLKHTQVEDPKLNKSTRSDPAYHKHHPAFLEWTVKTQTRVPQLLSNSYEKSLEAKVISYPEAQREIEKLRSHRTQQRSTPSSRGPSR